MYDKPVRQAPTLQASFYRAMLLAIRRMREQEEKTQERGSQIGTSAVLPRSGSRGCIG
jgi:hypothetical protein